jgi:3-methyladenine DNA glycosylase AlkC
VNKLEYVSGPDEKDQELLVSDIDRLLVTGTLIIALYLFEVGEVIMSSSDQSAQPQREKRTPSLTRSPKGHFDAQAALRALETGDEEGLVAVLRPIKWGKTGYQAKVTIEEALGPGTDVLYDWARRLADRPEPAPRAIAAPLFRHYWSSRPDEIQARLLQIAADEDWWVREAAHSTMGSLLVTHFDAFYSILQTWAEHPSPNVRRGVVIAARKAANERREEWADALLDLIEPLLADRKEYVRKNLGSYAIGDGLLRCHPQPTLARLRRWADDPREEVRWNVAMAFRSFGGTRHLEEALEVLEQLAADERRFVWRAAAAALHYLGRRQPEVVRPVVEDWLQDEQRVRAAKTALRYMTNPRR